MMSIATTTTRFSPMRLVFMGTPAFALPTLAALHKAGHDIAAVYTQLPRPAGRGQKETPSPVHEFATAHGLPVCTPVSLKSPEAQAEFASHKAEIAVVVAYGLLLPKPILEAYPLGCINVHPSLLPRWRGAAPIQRAVMAGDKETAIVIMQMDEGLDTGGMLLVKHFPVPEGISAGALHDQLAHEAAPMVLETIHGLKNKKITPVAQSHTGMEYAKKITKEECKIYWNKPAKDIYHQILGLSPTPGAYFHYAGEDIKVFEAAYEPVATSSLPGTLLDDALGIECKPGVLRLKTLQRPGKKRVSAEDFLRGFAIARGTLLN